jgi:hypothetical protein
MGAAHHSDDRSGDRSTDRHWVCSSYFPGGQGLILHSGGQFGAFGPPTLRATSQVSSLATGARIAPAWCPERSSRTSCTSPPSRRRRSTSLARRCAGAMGSAFGLWHGLLRSARRRAVGEPRFRQNPHDRNLQHVPTARPHPAPMALASERPRDEHRDARRLRGRGGVDRRGARDTRELTGDSQSSGARGNGHRYRFARIQRIANEPHSGGR